MFQDNPNAVKQALREHLLKTCSEQELKRWFDPLGLSLSEDGRQASILFPHPYFVHWFEARLRGRFEAELAGFFGNGCSVQYRSRGFEDRPAARAEPAPAPAVIEFPFDAKYTFETFLPGSRNEFPLRLAREVAARADGQLNPFVICGASGTGKTHLLRAIANEISKRHDRSKIYFCSAAELDPLYRAAAGQDQIQAHSRLLAHEFLFLDDLHQIEKHPALQEQLIVVFNHFSEHKKQMVFCCRDRLAGCAFLDPNLLSRLEGGLIVGLKAPDLEVRVRFVQERCRQKKLPLSKEHVLTLAQRYQDFRYLQGMLLRLLAYRDLVRKNLSERDFDQIIHSSEESTSESLKPEGILAAVAERYNVSLADLTGTRRHQNVALARQVAMYLCRSLLGLSYPVLGRVFGGKDHSTVIYSVSKIEQLQDDDKDLKQVLKELKKRCLLAE